MRNDKDTPLNFDNFVSLEKPKSNPKDPKKKETKKVPNSLLAIAKAAGAKCFNHLEEQCDAKFVMHLGLRRKTAEVAKKKYCASIEINLGWLNP